MQSREQPVRSDRFRQEIGGSRPHGLHSYGHIVVRRQNEDGEAGAAFPDVGDQPARIEIGNPMIQQYGIEAHSILCAEHGDRSFTSVGKNGPPASPRSQSGEQSALCWPKIGRESCRERGGQDVWVWGVAVSLKKKRTKISR